MAKKPKTTATPPAYKPASIDERRVRYVSVDERRVRFEMIEGLMVAGLSVEQIAKAARKSFGMTKPQTQSYVARIRDRWTEEEKEARPHNKSQATRRIVGHIAEARRDKNWSAVAQLEKLLSDMQGTKEPTEINVNVDATMSQAIVAVVANLTPERRAAMIEEQRRLRELAGKPVVVQASNEQASASTGPVSVTNDERERE